MQGFCQILWRKRIRLRGSLLLALIIQFFCVSEGEAGRVGVRVGAYWVWVGRGGLCGGGGRLFQAGRLLTFSAFRMGAYSRWALIWGWVLIWINTVFTQDFTLSAGTVELRLLKCGCLRSVKIAGNCYHNGLLREQFPPLIMPTMSWIETHQPWARFVIHQSLTIMVV